jgi:ribonuclease Z
LYHESTFLSEREDLAEKTKHSTAKQAAQIAKMSLVGKLVLGHYSSRYTDLELFRKEAQEIFQPVELAQAGLKISIDA